MNLAASARVIPFALFIAALAVRSHFEPVLSERRLDARWLYALQAGLAGAALVYFWPRLTELRAMRIGLRWFAAAIGWGLLVFVLWINLTAPWMRLGEPAASFVPVDGDGSLRWDLIALRVFGAVLVVPIIEEVFWRSFLMRWIDRRAFLELAPIDVSRFALRATSAVFALAHDLWFAGFIGGIVYGEIYRRSGKLWCSVIAHAVTNAALAAWVVTQRQWGFW